MTTTSSVRRKRALAYGSAVLVLAATFSIPTVVTAVTDPGGLVLTPPEPTGPHAVGRTELHLVDPDRGHPWVEEAASRDVMVSVWYPAGEEDGDGTEPEPAPYITPSVADVLMSQLEQGGLHRDTVDFAASRANALQDAAVSGAGPFPVVLYSPGFREPRFLNTSNIEELVSHGYVVAAMDHPYETLAVDMPDGRVLRTNAPSYDADTARETIAVRRADTRLVLDGLTELAEGASPDASDQESPAGLGEALDLNAVGMFGHSAGGFTAAEAMLVDDRIDAGINMDGSIGYHSGDEVWADANLRGTDRPFALLTAGVSGSGREPHHSGHDKGYRMFVEASSAPVLEVYMADGEHMGYTDQQWILPAIEEFHHPGGRAWDDLVAGAIGTVDPEGSVRAQRAHITAFFDAHLRGEDAPVLEGPSSDLPEVEFIDHDW
ncbi:acetylhydrolase [Nocardiopsis sp. TSRI0078]|uniref:alpha/beta hydrolase family protein n=1 Tax=unclassified Nocardiopsis TaxID=2649073 RepID=UPI00093D4977|nr:alpha/beta hydrolase [Nocardiopsis sp. TSRI0078]OKI13446.1 acetylhydrolase [Nocardiopsis sp. TSRI0078]